MLNGFIRKILAAGLLVLFLFILVAPALGQTATNSKDFLGNRTQQLYNDKNGLVTSEANAIIQTSDGYIWIGSYGGLMRYDGKNITAFSAKDYPSFTATSIRYLYEAKDKTLYIASNDAGLFAYNNGVFSPIASDGGKLSNSIRCIAEDENGQIYAATTNGIGVIVNNKLMQVDDIDLGDNYVISIAVDKSNNLWGVDNSGNVFAFKNNKPVALLTRKDLGGIAASSVLADSKGRVLVGTLSNRIFELILSDSGISSKSYDVGEFSSISYLYEDRNNTYWLCGEKGFGYLDDNFIFTKVTDCLVDTFAESMIQDYEGNYWVASSKVGVVKLTLNKFSNYTFINKIQSGVVNATLLWQNNLYIATDTGLIISGSEGQITNELTNLISGSRVRGLYADSKGNLWICSYGEYGLIKYTPDRKIISWGEKEGLTVNKVRTVLESKDGTIYVATTNGINIIKNDKIIRTYSKKDGLLNSYILSLYEDDHGVLYAGSDGGGIFKIEGNKIENLSEKDGLSSGIILRMVYDKNKGLMFISSGGKLDICRDGKTITSIKNFPSDVSVFDIKIFGEKLLLLTSKGLYIAETESLLNGNNPRIEIYDKNQGLLSSITSNSWNEFTASGELYLSCDGVYTINVSNIVKNTVKPRIAINNITVDGVRYEYIDHLKISSNAFRITIDFSVLSFCSPDYNTVEYQLIGLDKEPISQTLAKTQNVSYTNLKGGSYTFLFRGTNADGVASESEIRLEIEKEPTVFERPITYIIAVMMLILFIYFAVWGYFNNRTKKILNKQQEYKEITKQTIMAIARTIDAKDTYTKGHSLRVADYSVALAKELGLAGEDMEALYYTALLHDIGKIGIDDFILNKPSKLTDEEYAIVKEHVTKGGDILKDITLVHELSLGALYHHEKYDGTGYNIGLSGEDIPLFARIIGVADAFDAMTSIRPYRGKVSLEIVLAELKQYKGIQFDPKIADIMCNLIENNRINFSGAQGVE